MPSTHSESLNTRLLSPIRLATFIDPRSKKIYTGNALPFIALSLAMSMTFNPAHANNDNLAELSLEELASIRVTSVSKRPESLASAPASITVITNDDIRRSGATTLPEAMRLAPNLQIARVDARNYAITARGFNSPFENKMLVLIDGRTVYTPLFSGVFWDAQDVVLEDIERIEVISGPGATLWGANAVNGVINIITRSSAATRGALVALGAGAREKNGVLRYGGELANGGHYRVYGKYIQADDTRRANGTPVLTGWDRQQAGFRTDWGPADRGFTLQGDAYTGGLHQLGTRDIKIGGANLLGRVNATLDGGANASLQAYWDYTERDQPGAFVERLHTIDLQFQHASQIATIHNLVWGAGYRMALDHVRSESAFAFLPGARSMHWANLFVQDEIAIADKIKLTAGLKAEHNHYTGLEWLPTVRLAWQPTQQSLLWSAMSRSVRTPSRIDRDFFSPTNPAVVNGVARYTVAGGPDFESEIANVLEMGYRAQFGPTMSYSATMFYSRYDKLRTLEPNPRGSGSVFDNRAEGTTRGIEMRGNWQPAPAWRLSAGLVAQKISTTPKPESRDASAATGLATSDPSNFWMLRASHDIAPGQELDVMLRHSGKLNRPAVPAYTTMDVRYGWKIRRDLELSIVGQNLLDRTHPEYGAAPGRSEYERGVFVKMVWKQ